MDPRGMIDGVFMNFGWVLNLELLGRLWLDSEWILRIEMLCGFWDPVWILNEFWMDSL